MIRDSWSTSRGGYIIELLMSSIMSSIMSSALDYVRSNYSHTKTVSHTHKTNGHLQQMEIHLNAYQP